MAKKKATSSRVKGRGGTSKGAKAPEKEILLDVPVVFNSVSIGKATANLGLKLDRKVIRLSKADNLFVDRRLDCRVILGRAEDTAGQEALVDDAHDQVESSCDVKGFRVGSESYTTALTFFLHEIAIEDLAKFSKGTGRLQIAGAEDIPDGPTATEAEAELAEAA